ncbi:MAG TPA: cache domain-containing protein, partial [Kofleriaceae bacterium]
MVETLGVNRFGRFFASPASVLVILPLLVISVGVVVLMLGRKATHDSAETLVRRLLVAQAIQVQRDVESTLDQSEPVLAGLRLLAEPALATPDAMQRLHDLVVGRAGIYNTSIAFPVGVIWSTYKQPGSETIFTAESRDGERINYAFESGMHELSRERTTYDARTRPHYKAALEAKQRTWLKPRVFSTSHKTGLTVTEPVYTATGELVAVLTIDFDVESLSGSIAAPPIKDARTVVFTREGTMLAYPSMPVPTTKGDVLRYTDYHDPRLDALFTALGKTTGSDDEQRFFTLPTSEGTYFASTAHLGTHRANTAAPVDWMLATLVPEPVLFDATRQFGRDAIVASAAALLIALGVALMFAWNMVRMRRVVAAARAEAKSARERADELGSYRLVE